MAVIARLNRPPMKLTYAELIAQRKQSLPGAWPDSKSRRQNFRNHVGTLVSYLSFTGKTSESKVGAEMLSAFNECTRSYIKQLQLAPRAVADRRSHLRVWHELANELVRTARDSLESQPPSDGTFEAMCAESHRVASEWKDNATAESRSPKEPIRGLLALNEPLSPLFRAVKALDEAAASAAPGSLDEALHKRDALLLSMLLANPLRRRNYVLMTYADDGSGNLYQKHDGYRLRFDANDFKTERSTANSCYDAPLPQYLSRRIEEYLEEFRPRILRANPGAPWVFPSRRATLWHEPSRQLERVTRRLVPETQGLGLHAIRHLVVAAYHRELVGPGDDCAPGARNCQRRHRI